MSKIASLMCATAPEIPYGLTVGVAGLLVQSIKGLMQAGLFNTFGEGVQPILLLKGLVTFINTRKTVRLILHSVKTTQINVHSMATLVAWLFNKESLPES